ncbi:MAG: restriction endonuclease subunit S [Treponema sp.]|nr:restriction endonuclease subunit S [Treponema sp.]
MSEWKKVKIGDFLTEREGRYKPNDKEISKYQRLDKIDFSGHIHISDKPTKTDMIIVFPGDLIISGINVAKGAISVYQGKEPVCATIHYSSYTFDDKKVDLDYFKYFVKSPAFIFALQQQVKGGIKTEIKPKHLLPLEISLPDLSTQKEIVKVLSKKIEKVELVKSEIESQKNYAKQLRQNILQEAIEGKLTEEWRKENPVVKGNPDFDAESLFEKIQEEKCHTDSELLRNSKKKVFESIAENEQPFEIPEGWKWVKLEHLAEVGTGATPLTSEKKYYENGTIPWITSSSTGNDFVSKADVFITEIALKETNCSLNPKGTLVVAMYGQGKTRGQITELCIEAATNQACATIKIFEKDNVVLKKYIKFVFKKMYEEIRSLAQGGTQPNLNLGKIANTIFPLPPLAEQKEIVSRVEKLLANVTELEKQITEREEMTKQLMQSIMKDAFREE